MGLIDFVKDAGESLLKRVGATEEVDTEAVVKGIHDHGFQVEDLNVSVEGDVATVSGRANSQADRERVVLQVGNTQGIARVNDQIELVETAPAEPEGTYYEVKRGDTVTYTVYIHNTE